MAGKGAIFAHQVIGLIEKPQMTVEIKDVGNIMGVIGLLLIAVDFTSSGDIAAISRKWMTRHRVDHTGEDQKSSGIAPINDWLISCELKMGHKNYMFFNSLPRIPDCNQSQETIAVWNTTVEPGLMTTWFYWSPVKGSHNEFPKIALWVLRLIASSFSLFNGTALLFHV